MTITIERRGARDWVVTVDGEYAGVVTQFTDLPSDGSYFVHSNDRKMFDHLFDAVGALLTSVGCERRVT